MAADAIADAPRVPVAGLFGAFYSEQFTYSSPLQLLFADVTPTSDGGWAVTGFGPQNGTSAALRVAKLGPTGDVTWMMAALGSVAAGGARVRQLGDGSYVVLAQDIGNAPVRVLVGADGHLVSYQSSTGLGSPGEMPGDASFFVHGGLAGDATLARFDATGAIVWSKVYATANSDAIVATQLAPDGSVVACGYFDNALPSSVSPTVLKLASDGSITWQATLIDTSGATSAAFSSVAAAPDGGVVVTGLTIAGSVQTTVVAKLDATGALGWQHALTTGVGGPQGLRLDGSLLVTADGGILLGGSFNQDVAVGDPANSFRAVVVRLRPDGALAWAQQYEVLPGANPSDRWHAIMGPLRAVGDGGVVLAGIINLFSGGGIQPFVLKLDPADGVLAPISSPFALLSIDPGTYAQTASPVIGVGGGGGSFNTATTATPADWNDFAQYDSVLHLTP